jgi:hypothetical protein
MTVYALLVGIDDYDRSPLRGAVNDIHAAQEFLDKRVEKAQVRQLVDGDATRQAVIDGFRNHLGRAGRNDVALFWFAGHGSDVEVPAEFAAIEPSGRMQTLVCVDSRRLRADCSPVPDLLDKELSLLLTEVAVGGAHVVAVLDCCHAAGATRDLPGARMSVRSIDPPELPAPAGGYLPELGAELPGRPGEHVLLAACELTQRAIELALDGEDVRGVFSHALLTALQGPDSTASYRRLLAQARSVVQVHVRSQTPVVLPAAHGLVDEPFLGGEVLRPPAFHLRWAGDGGWEVDAGACHGLPAPGADGAPLLFVPGDDDQQRLLRVRRVDAVASRVEPVGWTPDRQRVHPVLLASVPVPRCGLVVGGSDDDDAAVAALVTGAVSRSGPAGGPSPWVRVVQPDDPVAGERLWIGARIVDGRPVLRLLRADEDPAAPDVPGFGPESVAEVVRNAEHIARWDLLRGLTNPLSGVADDIRIEIFPAEPGERRLPPGRDPLRPGPTGEIRIAYERAGGPPPRVFIQLRNMTDRMLYATLLDLTDQHRSHDSLFPCTQIAPVGVGAALSGQPVEVKLPAGRVTGVARDWLKLIVAEERFSTLRFQLPALGEPATRGAGAQPQPRVLGGVGENGAGGDWATALLPIVTTVPVDPRPRSRAR